ncbi:hypothetical protein ACVWW1_008472 [Bradyrhizobium sp. JR3.5]
MTSNGAAIPIVSYEGVTAKTRIAALIMAKLAVIAGRRPTRSEYEPSTMAPIGLVTKPAPNVASDSMRLANGSLAGKNA